MMQKFMRDQMFDGVGGSEVAEKMSLGEAMEEEKESVRANKKKELRDQERIVQ